MLWAFQAFLGIENPQTLNFILGFLFVFKKTPSVSDMFTIIQLAICWNWSWSCPFCNYTKSLLLRSVSGSICPPPSPLCVFRGGGRGQGEDQEGLCPSHTFYFLVPASSLVVLMPWYFFYCRRFFDVANLFPTSPGFLLLLGKPTSHLLFLR